jgi:DNA sulfur modification protein DndB
MQPSSHSSPPRNRASAQLKSGGKQFDRLLIPALRAHLGDWVYYIGFLKLRDLAQRVRIADEIHRSENLRDMIQRALKGERTKEIQRYLVTQPQRFFNTIVIGTYGGEPPLSAKIE